MANILNQLQERGLVKQVVYEDELRKLLTKEKVVCYMGFDPTADSLHIGSLASILFLVRMQKAGHTPIALVGGATGRIGDPSDRNDMRPMMSAKEREHNVQCIKKQLEQFFDKNVPNKLIVVNNDDWISKLSYIEMLNAVGLSMSINRMLSFDCFKKRMENGLTFLEFNYMPMQAYDFWYLNKKYNCVLQLGGDDQWANILAGVELIRKKENKPVFCMTTPLLTKSDKTKMGKTAGGAVWLAGEKFSDYDFYQYLRNIEDDRLSILFRQLTFLPLDEIDRLCSAKGQALNIVKERLAYEVTKIVRGEPNAKVAQEQSRANFGGKEDEMPIQEIMAKNVDNIVDLLLELKMASSRGDAKRLIDGKGIKIDDEIIENYEHPIIKPEFVLQKGKKSIQKVKLV